jgi:hypothetical protein
MEHFAKNIYPALQFSAKNRCFTQHVSLACNGNHFGKVDPLPGCLLF